MELSSQGTIAPSPPTPLFTAIDGNNGTIRNNTITDALVGVLTVGGNTGNTFFDTVTTISDPAAPISVSPGPSL